MLKIKVEKQYQVGGHIFTVVLDPDLEKRKDWGVIDHLSLRIYINPTRPESQILESLVHELLHAIDGIFVADSLSEAQVSGLAQGLLQILTQHGVELDWSEIPYKSNELLPQGEKR